MKTRISVQERLKDLRVEQGLNLEELAQKTGISKSALGSYENDNDEYKEINHGSLLKLTDFYQVSVDYLLGLTNNRKYENTPIEELHLSDEVVELPVLVGALDARVAEEVLPAHVVELPVRARGRGEQGRRQRPHHGSHPHRGQQQPVAGLAYLQHVEDEGFLDAALRGSRSLVWMRCRVGRPEGCRSAARGDGTVRCGPSCMLRASEG